MIKGCNAGCGCQKWCSCDNLIVGDWSSGENAMAQASLKFTYWQDESMWLGYLDEFPDYMTQGQTEDELRENLLDLYKDLSGGQIPVVRKHGELKVA